MKKETAAQKKIHKIMSEFSKGELDMGTSGKKVKSRRQAIAIALSEAGKSRKDSVVNYARKIVRHLSDSEGRGMGKTERFDAACGTGWEGVKGQCKRRNPQSQTAFKRILREQIESVSAKRPTDVSREDLISALGEKWKDTRRNKSPQAENYRQAYMTAKQMSDKDFAEQFSKSKRRVKSSDSTQRASTYIRQRLAATERGEKSLREMGIEPGEESKAYKDKLLKQKNRLESKKPRLDGHVLTIVDYINSLLDRMDRGAVESRPCGKGWTGTKPGCVRAKSPKKQATERKPRASESGGKKNAPKPGSLAELSPDEIDVDPKRFQYKIIGEHTSTGEVGSLHGVKRYDPNLAGIVQVWQDPADGKTYVVNGHNRLALAKKLGADKVAVRYLDVKDAKEARAVGALTNIAEGRGTALDAAKFFKDTGLTREDLDRKGIPVREKIAQDGAALAGLNDTLFRKVIDGQIPVERAAIIGGSGLNHTQQQDLHDLAEKQAKKGRKITNDVLSELVDTVKASEQQTETQFDLFGASEVQQTNAVERASLQSAIKRRLSRDKKLFGIVSKSTAAKDLAKAGNVIDVESSRNVSNEASATLNVFDQLKNIKGGVGDALNQAANRIKSGESAKAVEADLYNAVKEAIKNEVGGNARQRTA